MSPKQLALSVIVALCLTLLLPLSAAQQHSHFVYTNARLGSVHFETSCSPRAQAAFDRAMPLLHSFEFGQAIAGFQAALAADPGCAMADWGIALSRWGNPFAPGLKPPTSLQQGREAIKAAQAAKPKTQRERDYIAAAAGLYANFETTTQQSRLEAYCDSMSKVAAQYPADTEASIFYALSLAMSADLADKTYSKQLKAGAILEKLFANQPQHPGLAHYIIHSYDFPPLAPRALAAARAYAKIAPDSPHALHMPSHIFTRVGSWGESIDTNLASVATARREGSVNEELHASDYLVYAYLQSGRDAAAAGVVRALPEVESRFHPDVISGAAPASAAYFAMAAIPARYALERGDWASASRLRVRPSTYPYTEAITWFARGMGSARLGEIAVAGHAAQQLAAIHQRLVDAKEPYWALQVEIQRLNVVAWTALARKDHPNGALEQMRKAVEMEDGTEKSAVTPGPMAPAHELLAEMLLQLNRPGEALQEFQATLAGEPNRFRALYGAARSAELAGNVHAAQSYASALLKVCGHADQPGRAELARARAILNPVSTGNR